MIDKINAGPKGSASNTKGAGLASSTNSLISDRDHSARRHFDQLSKSIQSKQDANRSLERIIGFATPVGSIVPTSLGQIYIVEDVGAWISFGYTNTSWREL